MTTEPTRASTAERLPDKWSESGCAGLSEVELLLYRSRLLGSDLRITNYGGGNTSAKLPATDPVTGEPVEVLWVKGSGGDLASIGLDGFATLYVSKLHELKQRYGGIEQEDEMADRLAHCVFGSNPRATSIDTPPDCFVPHRHVDHVHADAIIAIAAARQGERLTHEVFGDARSAATCSTGRARTRPRSTRPPAAATSSRRRTAGASSCSCARRARTPSSRSARSAT
jgi:rhamnose utilization protein RhaD (predicted bifunctional aldolase and dehydrogenase)